MPELRQEETKRSRFRILSTAAVGAAVAIAIATLGVYAWYQKLKTDAANQVVLSRYLAWQSGAIAKDPPRLADALLLAIEAYRRDPAPITAAALHDRLDPTPMSLAQLKHGAPVNLVKFTPDGKYLVSASDEGGVRVWDHEKGTLLAQLDQGKPVPNFKFGPGEGEITAVFRTAPPRRPSEDTTIDPGRVVSWRWTSNSITSSHDAPAPIRALFIDRSSRSVLGITAKGIWRVGEAGVLPFTGFDDPHGPRVMGLSPDGTQVAISDKNAVHIYEAKSGQQLQSIAIEAGVRVSLLRFSQNGDRLLIGQSDGKTSVWEWRSHTKLFDHEGYSDPWTSAFSPDGEYVAEIDYSVSASLRIWRSSDGRDIFALDGNAVLPGLIMLSAAYTSDSRALVIGLGDRSLRVIRMNGEGSAASLQFTSGALPRSGALHPGGQLLAAGDDDGLATIWRMDRSRAAAEFADAPSVEIGGGDGRVALLGTTLRIVDPNLSVVAELLLDTRSVRVARFSQSGGMLALGRSDGKLAVVDLANSKSGRWLDPPDWASPAAATTDGDNTAEIIDLRFSEDDRKLVVVRRGGVAEMDLPTSRETLRLKAALPFHAAFSPDGSLVATKKVDGEIRVYDLRMFEETWVIPSLSFDTSMAFSPDGKLFAARTPSREQPNSNREGTMTVWNVATRQPVLAVPVKSLISEMAFSATSELFAFSEDEIVRVWNLSSKKRIDLVQRHSIGVLEFHPTESFLAVGYDDSKIRVWSVSDAQILTEIPQDEPIEFGSMPIRFTRDGRYLVHAEGGDWSAFGQFAGFFAWQPQDLVPFACARALHKALDTVAWDENLRGQPYRETCGDP